MTWDVVLSGTEVRALREGHHAIAVDVATFRVEGSGTIACLQGMLTNDVVAMPSHGMVWGAFLTPKGMIITDAWLRRDGDAAWVIVPASAAGAVSALFTKTLPPRLARATDVTAAVTVRWLVGADGAMPEDVNVTIPSGLAPFRAMVLSPDPALEVDARLRERGWLPTPTAWADAARLLAGWPALGREIDDRTLPQEVRFDELGGVRYDKGCYTGQETVARLHFRGHANRVLRGLHWEKSHVPSGTDILLGERPVGTIRTTGQLGNQLIALALIRREVEPGETVVAGGGAASVVALPDWGREFQAG